MKFELLDEFRLDSGTKEQLSALLKISFPEENFSGRTYFKQLPHYRLLLWDNQKLVGQLGLDYRVMSLNEKPIKVLGIIDLAILPEYRGQGLGGKLLLELDRITLENLENIDFLFLATDKFSFYEKYGFKITAQKAKWLTIEQHINYGIQEQYFEKSFMYKKVGKNEWSEDGILDLFGYWY